MHPNPAFRGTPEAEALAFALSRGFGTLTVNGAEVPLLAHVPFCAAGDALECHLVRSNPALRALPARAVLAVTGPDGYVSPDWYGLADQVPTWNYVAVHVEGQAEPLPAAELRAHLDRLSAAFEARLDKAPWTTAKMTPEVLERMMRAIVPVRLTVEAVRSTFKLGQNKQPEARLAAAERIGGGVGSELAALASMMRDP